MDKFRRDCNFYNRINSESYYKIPRSNHHSLLILVISLFVFSSALKAQNKILSSIKAGLQNCYSFKWEKADKVFKTIIANNPEDPRGYHYEASIYLWYFLSNQDEKDLDTFEAYSDTAIDKAKEFLDKNPDNVSILYTLGTIYSCRAIAFSKAEKFIDAAWASKKSESYLSETLAKDSTFYDAYLGLGLYNFAVGQIPSAYKWALSLAGINGDKKKGLEYIKTAARKGRLSKVEAKYYLSQILTNFINKYSDASVYLKNLIKEYPSNLLFLYSYSVLKIKDRQLNEAAHILKKILEKNEPKFQQLISFSNFLMGDIFYRRNNFDSAKVYYTNFINTTLDNDYTGIAYYRMAISYEILGQRDVAIKYFKLSGKGNMDLDDDIYAKRKGENYIEHPLLPIEVSLILDNNLIENGKYEEAYDSLSALLTKVKTSNFQSEIYLHLSQASYWLGNYDESSNYALKASSAGDGAENWVKPFALYYAARAEYKIDRRKAADKNLDDAESYTDYDYQNKLKNLIFAMKLKN